MIYRGKNEFYDGWLARHYRKPFDAAKSGAWREGWNMADETSYVMRIFAYVQEIYLGRNIEPAP